MGSQLVLLFKQEVIPNNTFLNGVLKLMLFGNLHIKIARINRQNSQSKT